MGVGAAEGEKYKILNVYLLSLKLLDELEDMETQMHPAYKQAFKKGARTFITAVEKMDILIHKSNKDIHLNKETSNSSGYIFNKLLEFDSILQHAEKDGETKQRPSAYTQERSLDSRAEDTNGSKVNNYTAEQKQIPRNSFAECPECGHSQNV